MKKVLFISIMVMLVMALVLPACAPAAPAKPAETKPATPPATTTPATPPAATTPATTPSVATTPAATPAPTAKPTSYEAETYTSDLGFSFKYPKAWKVAAKPYATAVFYANDGGSPLPDLVFVDVRDGTSVKDSAVKALGDFVAAKGVSVTPTVESEKTVTLADGKQGTEIVLVADVLFQKKKGAAVGVVKDGKTYVVVAGVDTGKLELWKEMAATLAFK